MIREEGSCGAKRRKERNNIRRRRCLERYLEVWYIALALGQARCFADYLVRESGSVWYINLAHSGVLLIT